MSQSDDRGKLTSREVTYLYLRVFPLMYCTYRLPYMKPLFIVAVVLGFPRLSRPYTYSLPLHFSVPVSIPQSVNVLFI